MVFDGKDSKSVQLVHRRWKWKVCGSAGQMQLAFTNEPRRKEKQSQKTLPATSMPDAQAHWALCVREMNLCGVKPSDPERVVTISEFSVLWLILTTCIFKDYAFVSLCPMELSITEMVHVCTVQYGSHQEHGDIEHLKGSQSD